MWASLLNDFSVLRKGNTSLKFEWKKKKISDSDIFIDFHYGWPWIGEKLHLVFMTVFISYYDWKENGTPEVPYGRVSF